MSEFFTPKRGDRIVLSLNLPSWVRTEEQKAQLGFILVWLVRHAFHVVSWNTPLYYTSSVIVDPARNSYILIVFTKGEEEVEEEPDIAPEDLLGNGNG